MPDAEFHVRQAVELREKHQTRTQPTVHPKQVLRQSLHSGISQAVQERANCVRGEQAAHAHPARNVRGQQRLPSEQQSHPQQQLQT